MSIRDVAKRWRAKNVIIQVDRGQALVFRFLTLALRCTALCFRDLRRRPSHERWTLAGGAKLGAALAYMLMVLYLLVTSVVFCVEHSAKVGTQSGAALGVLTTIWMGKIWISLCFLFVWEATGQNADSLEVASRLMARGETVNCSLAALSAGFVAMVVGRLVTLLIALIRHYANYGYAHFFEAPFANFGSFFAIVLTLHVFNSFYIILFYFVVVFDAARERLFHLQHELVDLARHTDIISFYSPYRDALRGIATVNMHFKLFRIYSMVSCACVIMTTFYFIDWKNGARIGLLMPEVVLALTELLALVYAPSAMKRLLGNVKPALYDNDAVWDPYDARKYDVARHYIALAEFQVDEISVWGTTYARKPFFITISFLGVIFVAISTGTVPDSLFRVLERI